MNKYLKYPIVFIDSDCIFCNYWGNFIIKNDKSNSIHISSPSSDLFKEFAFKYPNHPSTNDTIILFYKNQYYIKSSAVIKISLLMKSWFTLLFFGYLIPKFIRDKVYDFIALRRKAIMKDNCYIIELKNRERFIE